MVKISGCITKTVELLVWGQQNGGRCLLIGHTWVSTLPAPSNKGKTSNESVNWDMMGSGNNFIG